MVAEDMVVVGMAPIVVVMAGIVTVVAHSTATSACNFRHQFVILVLQRSQIPTYMYGILFKNHCWSYLCLKPDLQYF